MQITYTRTIKTVVEKEPVPHPGRNPLPPHLRRIDVIVEPDHIPEDSIKIGEEITEHLEYIPGELIVKRTVQVPGTRQSD
jgi:transposase